MSKSNGEKSGLRLKRIPLAEIRPYWRNPRKNAESVPMVKASILENGYVNPISVDAKNVIVTGHTRYKAIVEMSDAERQSVGIGGTIEVIDLSHLPADKVKRYRIVDNKAGEKSTWDYDLLIPELREIDELESLQVYFPDLDLPTAVAPPVMGAVRSDSDEDVEDAEDDIREKFTDISGKQDAALREVICPHCTKIFFVERAELEAE